MIQKIGAIGTKSHLLHRGGHSRRNILEFIKVCFFADAAVVHSVLLAPRHSSTVLSESSLRVECERC